MDGAPLTPSLPLLWMAPLFSGGGYSSEALAFASGLATLLPPRSFAIRQFAEPQDPEFVQGIPQRLISQLAPLTDSRSASRAAHIVVCHATPDAWVPSKFPGWDSVAPCPPPNARIAIGRTMFETDGLPADWVQRCNSMDEIWVPTEFHKESFAAAGVDPGKLIAIGEPVDTVFFDPALYEPLPLQGDEPARPFRFLSVFKWEARKGWEVLLEAFLAEFATGEAVQLLIKTRPFYSSSNFEKLVDDFAARRGLPPPGARPVISLLTSELTLQQLPRLYRAADAFVLPSRGEGWGRPHVEAMSMGLPVIATNWSGPTAFLSSSTGYPLDYKLVDVAAEMNLAGHRWAEPSLTHLRQLMRHVFVHREEARARGAAARACMQADFSPVSLAEQVAARLMRLEAAEDNLERRLKSEL